MRPISTLHAMTDDEFRAAVAVLVNAWMNDTAAGRNRRRVNTSDDVNLVAATAA